MKENPEAHRLYQGQSKDFFESGKKSGLGAIKRREFKKTGSRTILLGGELAGKAIVRIISKGDFERWSRAYKAIKIWRRAGFDYVPVEPIIEKDGKARASLMGDGRYRVVSKVLGQNMEDFLADQKNERQFGDMLRHQAKKIIDILEKNIGVLHRHPHNANFCVETNNGNPRLYIIDFDCTYDIGNNQED